MSNQLDTVLKEIKTDTINLLFDSENVFKSNETFQNEKIKEISEKFNFIVSEIQERQGKIENLIKDTRENNEVREASVNEELFLELNYSEFMYLKSSLEKDNLSMNHEVSEFERKYEMIVKKEKEKEKEKGV